jgi:hypothetical protein
MNKSAITVRNLKPIALIVTFYLLLLTFSSNAQGVGISQTGSVQNPSALLDIDGNDQGLLIPRLALTSTTDATTITNGNVTSLLIYNTVATANLVLGYYYWNGAVWKALGSPTDYYEVDATTNVPHTVGTSNVDSMVITTADAGNYRTEAVLDYTTVGGTIVTIAMADNIALRAYITGLAGTGTHAVGFLNETILRTGAITVIDVTGAGTLTGNIDYDANNDPNAVFVIRVSTTITAAALSTYTLSRGAQACNIFWIAGTTVVLTGAATVAGTYLSGTTAAAGAGAVINGRLLALAGTIVLTTVANFTVPTGTSALITMGVLNSFIVFSNAGAVTATAATAHNFTGDVGTATAAGNTGWDGLNGNTYFGAAALGFGGSFVMALDGTPIESTRIDATGSSVYFRSKTITTGAGGIISIMYDITLGTVTTGDRNIFSLRLD